MPEVPDAEVLWCLATGTGIGPFMSILHTAAPWQNSAVSWSSMPFATLPSLPIAARLNCCRRHTTVP